MCDEKTRRDVCEILENQNVFIKNVLPILQNIFHFKHVLWTDEKIRCLVRTVIIFKKIIPVIFYMISLSVNTTTKAIKRHWQTYGTRDSNARNDEQKRFFFFASRHKNQRLNEWDIKLIKDYDFTR